MSGAPLDLSLLLTRFFPGRSVVIHNLVLIKSRGMSSEIRRLGDKEELISAIEENFEIPRSVTMEALSDHEKFRDAWDGVSP